jgi:hypothetical protein
MTELVGPTRPFFHSFSHSPGWSINDGPVEGLSFSTTARRSQCSSTVRTIVEAQFGTSSLPGERGGENEQEDETSGCVHPGAARLAAPCPCRAALRGEGRARHGSSKRVLLPHHTSYAHAALFSLYIPPPTPLRRLLPYWPSVAVTSRLFFPAGAEDREREGGRKKSGLASCLLSLSTR